MADKPDDLGIPMRPAQPPVASAIPARIADVPRPAAAGSAPDKSADPARSGTRSEHTERRTMLVGRDISLSGDIRSCNRLVVEGSVEATLHDCREIEIAESGLFKGKASIEQAEVRGQFEGELVVNKRLLIRATGHVSGTISYGELEIERGGRVSGTIQENGLVVPQWGLIRAGE